MMVALPKSFEYRCFVLSPSVLSPSKRGASLPCVFGEEHAAVRLRQPLKTGLASVYRPTMPRLSLLGRRYYTSAAMI